MATHVRIRLARWADIDPVASLAADALHHTPLGQWLVPDATHRRQILADVLLIWVEHAMFFGDIHLTDDLTAAAVAFHRYRAIPPPANYRTRLTDAAGAHTTRFDLLDTLLTSGQPTEPHYHLALLVVRPDTQRAGRATAMLTHHRNRLDHIGLPSWATVPTDSQHRFARHGYTLRPTVTLPDGPTLHPMRRNAHPTSGATPINPGRLLDHRWQDFHV
ncbi:N-acetyltransferase [Micromonospora sp. KC207]|uniref:N-acetyltransferase n=1 Tax=Micromonospora sp. KC207 TaxID=2530377 RepID=UPI00104E3127|nr:N-acetyltransferase [Micromonospora sp. KC207]TDC58601.1 N-acetyltransferase [Micromonospora sp. KC207]